MKRIIERILIGRNKFLRFKLALLPLSFERNNRMKKNLNEIQIYKSEISYSYRILETN